MDIKNRGAHRSPGKVLLEKAGIGTGREVSLLCTVGNGDWLRPTAASRLAETAGRPIEGLESSAPQLALRLIPLLWLPGSRLWQARLQHPRGGALCSPFAGQRLSNTD